MKNVAKYTINMGKQGRAAMFFGPSTLTFLNFAVPWAMYSITGENGVEQQCFSDPQLWPFSVMQPLELCTVPLLKDPTLQGSIEFCMIKSVTALVRYSIFVESIPIVCSTYLVSICNQKLTLFYARGAFYQKQHIVSMRT